MNNNTEHPLMWSILAAVFCVLAILEVLQNKRLKRQIKDKCDDVVAKRIFHFSLISSLQFLFTVMLFFVIISLYNIKIKDLQDKIEDMQINCALQSMPVICAPAKKIEVEEPITLWHAPVENSIQDIFGGTDLATEANGNVSNIKTKYEELLVNYLLMDKCARANDNDYDIIMQMLQKEMLEAHAPQNLQGDILDAAKGSYEELYSRSDCKDPFIETSSTQYRAYITALSRQISPH